MTFKLPTEGVNCLGTPNMVRKSIPFVWSRNTETVVIVYFGLVNLRIKWNKVLFQLHLFRGAVPGSKFRCVWDEVRAKIRWKTKFDDLENQEEPLEFNSLFYGKPVQGLKMRGHMFSRIAGSTIDDPAQ